MFLSMAAPHWTSPGAPQRHMAKPTRPHGLPISATAKIISLSPMIEELRELKTPAEVTTWLLQTWDLDRERRPSSKPLARL